MLVAQVCAADRSRQDVEQPDRAKEPGFSRLNVPYSLAEAATRYSYDHMQLHNTPDAIGKRCFSRSAHTAVIVRLVKGTSGITALPGTAQSTAAPKRSRI